MRSRCSLQLHRSPRHDDSNSEMATCRRRRSVCNPILHKSPAPPGFYPAAHNAIISNLEMATPFPSKRPALPGVWILRPSRPGRRRSGIEPWFLPEPRFVYRGLAKPPIRLPDDPKQNLRKRRDKQHAIEAVQHAAVPRENMPVILDAGLALDDREGQVADLA